MVHSILLCAVKTWNTCWPLSSGQCHYQSWQNYIPFYPDHCLIVIDTNITQCAFFTYICICDNHSMCIVWLIMCYWNIIILLQLGYTALRLACSNGHTEVVKHLISNNADISATNEVSNCVLTICIVSVHCTYHIRS